MAMEYNHLLELIKTVSESNITGFQYEDGGTKIVISTVESGLSGINGTGNVQAAVVSGNVTAAIQADAVCPTQVAPVLSADNGQGVAQADMVTSQPTTGNIVKSPLVGTFYTAPSEDAEPFVSVGDKVKKGQTLAIVEAMKLMNDIESDYDGTVIEVFVKNGDCVEYGQPLFAIG